MKLYAAQEYCLGAKDCCHLAFVAELLRVAVIDDDRSLYAGIVLKECKTMCDGGVLTKVLRHAALDGVTRSREQADVFPEAFITILEHFHVPVRVQGGPGPNAALEPRSF